ncbi:MAG: hypothetical protein J2P17_18260, partial [Mycobacterium sp.]|nr:hypothetical protein [Mycobacterium sp.]
PVDVEPPVGFEDLRSPPGSAGGVAAGWREAVDNRSPPVIPGYYHFGEWQTCQHADGRGDMPCPDRRPGGLQAERRVYRENQEMR